MDGFSWNLILATFTKNVPEILNLVKIGQKYRALYMTTNTCFTLSAAAYVCGATIHRKLAMFITLLTWIQYVRKQHKGHALLRFHGKNGFANVPQCYNDSLSCYNLADYITRPVVYLPLHLPQKQHDCWQLYLRFKGTTNSSGETILVHTNFQSPFTST
jgi:hypothetical protein